MAIEEQADQIFANLLFPKIFKTFHMAIQPSKLIIAFLAMVVICLAGWFMDFNESVATTPGTNGRITELQIYLANPDRVKPYIEEYQRSGQRTGVFSVLWNFGTSRFHAALNSLFELDLPGVAENITDYFRAIGWAIKYHYFYCVIFMVIKLAVICLAGGSIARISALQFAGSQKPGLTEAVRFGISKFGSLFAAPLLAMGIIVVAGLCISVVGLLANIWFIGELILAISMPLALAAGVVISLFLIGTVAGFNLMWPAVAYDGSDYLDVISRSLSYIYRRPWSMALYTIVAAVYGAICYMFVRLFTFLVLAATYAFLQLGIFVNNSNQVDKLTAIWSKPEFMNLFGSVEPAAANWSQSAAAFIINLSVLVVVGLLVAFVLSFYFSANTIIYALMRKKVNNTPLEEIYIHPHTEESDLITAEPEQSNQQSQ